MWTKWSERFPSVYWVLYSHYVISPSAHIVWRKSLLISICHRRRPWFLRLFEMSSFFSLHFLTFWYKKTFYNRLVFSPAQPRKQPFLQGAFWRAIVFRNQDQGIMLQLIFLQFVNIFLFVAFHFLCGVFDKPKFSLLIWPNVSFFFFFTARGFFLSCLRNTFYLKS